MKILGLLLNNMLIEEDKIISGLIRSQKKAG